MLSSLRQSPLPLSYNPQDSHVMPPDTLVLTDVQADERQRLYTDKLQLTEKLVPVEGAYVYPDGDDRYHQANALASADRTLQMFTRSWGQPLTWATGQPRLNVKADAGYGLNCFYSRNANSLMFFHQMDMAAHKDIYTSDSGELVSHECGHAILDAVRPGYLAAWSPEVFAFHESFGDVMALIAALHDDRTLDKVAAETGGDLGKPNSAAAFGEEFGIAINHSQGRNATGGDYARNALNPFVYADPYPLPDNPDDPSQLGSEAHNFSRVWTGAVYEVLKGLVDEHRAAGMDPRAALAQGGEDLLQMYTRMLKKAPEGNFVYKDMAAALVQSENELNGGQHTRLIQEVMTRRKILPEGARLTSPVVEHGTRPLTVTLQGDRFGHFAGARVETLLSGSAPRVAQDALESRRLSDNLEHLIRSGDILYTEPHQAVSQKDLLKPDGSPYAGVVRWTEGHMSIERVPILA